MPNETGAGQKSRSLFSPADRARLLKLAIGKPTGRVVAIGGLEFDLRPLSFADGEEVLDLVGTFADLFAQVRAQGGVGEAELARLASSEGSRVITFVKKVLRTAGNVESPEEEALFEEWFKLVPLGETLRALVPAVLEANGITAFSQGNAPGPTGPAAQRAQKRSPSRTSPA